jgi:hypothetical protein
LLLLLLLLLLLTLLHMSASDLMMSMWSHNDSA